MKHPVALVLFILIAPLVAWMSGYWTGKRAAERYYIPRIGLCVGYPIDNTGTTMSLPLRAKDSPMIGTPDRAVTSAVDTILATDRNNRITYNSAYPVTVFLPQPRVKGGEVFTLCNVNEGSVTIRPIFATINGNAKLVLREGQVCFIEQNKRVWTATCHSIEDSQPKAQIEQPKEKK